LPNYIEIANLKNYFKDTYWFKLLLNSVRKAQKYKYKYNKEKNNYIKLKDSYDQ